MKIPIKFDRLYAHKIHRIMAELPFLAAFLYPTLNQLWWWKRITPHIEKEIQYESKPMYGVELLTYENKHIPPTYINVGGVMVPVDNGDTYAELKRILTKHISTDGHTEYVQYAPVLQETCREKEIHIHTPVVFEKMIAKYAINPETLRFTFPLKVNYYTYPNGVYLHKHCAFSASNRQELIKAVQWEYRLPLTMTIPIVAGVVLGAWWIKYGICDGAYPPFHYKRLSNSR